MTYRSVLAIVILISVHVALLGYSATRHSPTLNEPGHLVAGLTQWKFGRYEVYRVNPPLTHFVAAVPVVLAGYAEDWSGFYDSPGARPEFRMGEDLIKANGERSLWLFTLARWACIPFSVLGAVTCFLWARELWGTPLAGFISLSLWCFEPFLLGHAEMVTPDVPSTALGLLASFLFWRWLKQPTFGGALAAGASLGLVELTKSSWIILFVLWPLLAGLWWLTSRPPANQIRTKLLNKLHFPIQLAIILLLGIYVINLGYGFDGSFTPLKSYQFVSASLSGQLKPGETGNRFADSSLSLLPVPLPAQYVKGIDLQKKDFEDYGQPSYLRGEWKDGGWWHYYIYGLAVKTTHGLQGLLLAALLAVWCLRRDKTSSAWKARDLIVLLTPAACILLLVSSQQEFNHHVRYVLPVLAYAIVFCGAAALWWPARERDQPNSESATPHAVSARRNGMAVFTQYVVVVSLLSVPASLLWNLPHQLAYFNTLAGGRLNGHKHLLHSNLDWGQDLILLKEWMDAHPEARPLRIVGARMYAPEHLGLDSERQMGTRSNEAYHGWIAVSANDLFKLQSKATRETIHPRNLRDQLQNMQLVQRVGSAFWLFQGTADTQKSTARGTDEE